MTDTIMSLADYDRMIDAGERPRRPPAPGFGAMLADLRARRGVSQAKLADRAKLEHSAISRLESGDRNPRADTVRIIAQALELDRREASALEMAAGFVPDDPTALIAHEPELVAVYTLLDGDDLLPVAKEHIRRHLTLIADQFRLEQLGEAVLG